MTRDTYKLEDLIIEIAGRTLTRDREAEAVRRFPRAPIPPRPFEGVRPVDDEPTTAKPRAVRFDVRVPAADLNSVSFHAGPFHESGDALEAEQCERCDGWTTDLVDGRCVDCRALPEG